jgi:tetratricopeptide (TPR) repeat protein
MQLLIRLCVLGLVLGTAGAAAGQPTRDEIKQAILELGDERFAVREQAMKRLWQAGATAEADLLEAAKSDDPEIARRARVLLDRILYRIEPGTPKELVDLMQRYRNGTAEEQSAVIGEMLKLGSPAHPYLLRMLDAVPDERRRQLLEQCALDDWKILMPLMADGKDQLVEQLLDKAVDLQIDSVVPHVAAFWMLTKRTDTKIARLRSSVEAKGGPYTARLLAALYRSKGDWDGVLWAAERSQQSDLVRWALVEKGDWPELLTRFAPMPQAGLGQINGLGLLAAYQRLAQRSAAFANTVKSIQVYAGNGRRDAAPYFAAKVLLINEEPSMALELLMKYEQPPPAATELLVAQGKLSEALAVSEKAAKAESGQSFRDRSYHVGLLHRLGRVKDAREWLARLAKDMESCQSDAWLERQIELEARLGLREQAEAHAATRLEGRTGGYIGASFAALYPSLGEQAETVWRVLRKKYPQENPVESLKRLRRLDHRTATGDELRELLLAPAPDASWLPDARVNQAYEHLAELVKRSERADLATTLLSHSEWAKAPSGALVLLADTLAGAGQWRAAADAYLKIWKQDRACALACFLHGRALVQLGRVTEGQQFIEKSHRLLLGSEAAREQFRSSLHDRGFAADADLEAGILRRVAVPGTWSHGQSLNHDARLAQRSGDSLAAAAVMERNLLRLIPTQMGFTSIGAYIRETANVHIFRAKGYIAQGKIDDALREIERAEAIHPRHLDLPILLVGDLDKVGKTERAAGLFDSTYQRLKQDCRDFPECADAHNQLAWLAARCRRNLDEALEHAQTAVRLAPQVSGYVDTLAEVHFQRGEATKAIELMKQCLKMPSNNAGYYREQLARFEKGDPKSEPAPE